MSPAAAAWLVGIGGLLVLAGLLVGGVFVIVAQVRRHHDAQIDRVLDELRRGCREIERECAGNQVADLVAAYMRRRIEQSLGQQPSGTAAVMPDTVAGLRRLISE